MGPMRGAKGGPCCLPPPPPRPHIHSSFPLHFTSGPPTTRVQKAASDDDRIKLVNSNSKTHSVVITISITNHSHNDIRRKTKASPSSDEC